MAKTPILGLGNDGANEGYWRVQIRSERTGRWVKMGGAVKFETDHPNYGRISGVGFFVGGARAGVAYIRVENHEFIPDGTIIEVPSTDFEDVKAIIDPTPTEISEVVPPLAPPKPEVVDAPKLKAEMDGEEALTIIRKEAAKVAAEDGRFPVARSAEDVEAGAKRQYAGVFEALKAENPELVEEFENYEQFWAYAKKSLAAQLTTRWADSVDRISGLTKAANRIYARDVLGMDPDGLITFYRNSINNHTDVSTAAAGYVSLDRKMAFNYNSDRENVGANGRYSVKIKPDELLGLLGYSDPTDEHGGVVGPDVTAIPGRVTSLGNLRWDPLNPLMDPEDTKVGSGFGSSWFRFFSTGSTFEFPVLDANPFAEGENNNWSDFYANNGLQKGAIPGKYNEIYGEGAFERDFPSTSNIPGYERARKLFTEKDGLFALDPSTFENFFPGTEGTMQGRAGDRKDKALKFFEAIQQLSGDRFMVLRTEIEGKNPNVGIEVNPEFRSKAAGREMTAATAKDLKAGDVVQQGTEAALFGIIRAASHNSGVSNITVEWADGSTFNMKMPFYKKVKVWKAKKVGALIQWSDVNGVEVKGKSTFLDDILTDEGFKVDGSVDEPLSAVDADVISDDHKKAIDSYTRSSLWRTLNAYLRNDPTAEKDEKFEATISTLDDAIAENGEVFEAGRVFRGQRIETSDVDSKWPEIMENLKPGDLVTEESYLSASNSSLLAAREFGIGSYGTWSTIAEGTVTADAPGGNGSIFWAIDVPVGATAFAVPDGMGYGQGAEREVILPRGSQLRVKSLKKVKQSRTDLPDGEERYNYFVEVELVPVARQEKVVDAPTRLKEIGESEVFGGLITDESIDIGSIPTAPLPSIEVDDLSYEDVQVLKFYTADGYVDVNDYLRTGTIDTDLYTKAEMKSTVDEIDSIIDRLGYVDSDARVFRGMSIQPETQFRSGKKWSEVLSELQVGSTISEPGFLSTSSDPGQAFRFGAGGFTDQTFSGVQNSNNRVPRTEATVLWSIDVPAGSKALSLPYGDEMLSSEEEQEVILPRGTTLRVKAIRRVTQEGTDDAYNYYIDAEIVPVVAEQKQEVVDAPTVKEFDDLSNYKRIGGPLGSNNGGVYENEGGVKIYVKEPRSELHGENEVLASRLYERLGIETVEIRHGRLASGTEVTYSYWIDSAKSDLREHLDDDEDYLEKIQEGFAVDAWIANWDVAGSAYDNIVSDANSNPVRVDPGGALLFRARGEPKGGAFNDSANEIDTLADGTNPQSAEVFGSMTEEQKKKAAARLKWITPEEIEELVGSQISDPNVAESLAQTLIARRQNILKRFGLDGEDDVVGMWNEVDGVETIGDSPLFDDGRLTDTEFEASDLGDLTPIPTDFSQTPDDQIDALLGYTREDYDSINSILRGESLHPKQQQRFDELSKSIELIDETFGSQAPIKYGKTVFRGLIFYNPELATLFENLRPGDEYVEPAYLSTSTNPLSARGFSMMRDENPSAANASNHNVKEAQGTAFLAINLPNGSKALSLSEISEHATEGEILLPRGSRLRIQGVRRVKQNRKDGAEYYNYYVEANLVPERKKLDALTPEELNALSAEELMEALPNKDTATKKQIDAVKSYAHQGHYAINGYLREGEVKGGPVYELFGTKYVYNKYAENEFTYPLDRVTEEIKQLDELIEESPGLVEDTTLYRFIEDKNLSKTMMTTLKPGDELPDKGFTSTSRGFGWKFEGPDPDIARLVITAPKGTKGLYIDWFKTGRFVDGGEQEFLLPRDTTFIVEKVDGHLVYVTIKPRGEVVDAPIVEESSKPGPRIEESKGDSGVLDVIMSGEEGPDFTGLESSIIPRKMDSLSEEQIAAIWAYANSRMYVNINQYLDDGDVTPIGGKPIDGDMSLEEFTEKVENYISALDRAIVSAEPTKEDTKVFRGIPLRTPEAVANFDAYKPGDVINNGGYSSTSKRPSYGYGMAKSNLRDFAFLIVNVPAGSKTLALPDEITGGEEEVILPRRTDLKIKAVRKVKKTSVSSGVYYEYYIEVDAELPASMKQTVDAPIVDAIKPSKSVGQSDALDGIFVGGTVNLDALRSPVAPVAVESMSSESYASLVRYASFDYKDINGHLRGHGTNIWGKGEEDLKRDVENHISHIDEAIEGAGELTENARFFRGVGLTEKLLEEYENLKPGDVLEDDGYLSTSMNPQTALNYGPFNNFEDVGVLIINAPTGSNALAIPTELTGPEEEVLLPRGTKLKVRAIRRTESVDKSGVTRYKYYVEADIVPAGQKAIDAPKPKSRFEAPTDPAEIEALKAKAEEQKARVAEVEKEREERLKLKAEQEAKAAESYRMAHRPPGRSDTDEEGVAASLDKIDQVFSQDILDPEKQQSLFRTGDAEADKETFDIINSIKGNPDAEVTIYRGVPDGVDAIGAGDWVTLSPSYAQHHVDANVPNGKVISMKVKASELFTNADSINEWGYDPEPETVGEPETVDVGKEERPAAVSAREIVDTFRLWDAEAYDISNKTFLKVKAREVSEPTFITDDGRELKNPQYGLEQDIIDNGIQKPLDAQLDSNGKPVLLDGHTRLAIMFKNNPDAKIPIRWIDVDEPETVDAPAVEEPEQEPKVFDSAPSEIYSWLEDGGPETLTDEQKTNLTWYQTAGAYFINSYLRGIDIPESVKKSNYDQGIPNAGASKILDGIKSMDSLMSKSKGTPSDAIVYRAIDSNAQLKFDDLSIGSVLNDKGFLSTSVSNNFVKLFISHDKEGFIFKLTVPKGTKAITPHTKLGDEVFKHELELVLDRDSNIEITNIDYQNRIVEGVVSVNPKTDPEPETVDADNVEEAPATRTISTVADLVENYEELASRIEEIEKSSESKVEKGDIPMRALMEMLGKGGKPEMVDPSVLAGRKIFYRGGPELAIDSLKYSATDRIGLGVYGNGYYFSDNPDTAEVYSAMGPGGIDAGAIASAVWKPTAKVYDLDDLDIKLPPGYTIKMYLYTIANEAKERALEELNFSKKMTDSQRAIYKLFFSDQDVDAFATKLILDGYDGLSFTFEGKHRVQEKYTIVYNREALQIADI